MIKKLIIYSGILIVMVAGLTGCYRDVILPDAAVDPDGPAQFVSFKNDIAPMVNTKCALAGCHAAGGHKPTMTTGGSYQEIVNGGFVNTVIPKQSIIYIKINSEMREYIPSAVDRQKIYDWIRNGAPNN
ncbi:MAG: hypothetical protein HYU71_06725 [Bacteroidetes bacterium]|nr:hypothetical protein [Bacteroidota bacterium]